MASRLADLGRGRAKRANQLHPAEVAPAQERKNTSRGKQPFVQENGNSISGIVGTSGQQLTIGPTNN